MISFFACFNLCTGWLKNIQRSRSDFVLYRPPFLWRYVLLPCIYSRFENVLFHFTYNFSKSLKWIPAVRGGHDSGTFLCVGGISSIFVYTIDSDGVNTIHITIVRTTVSRNASISGRKCVNGAQAATTLELKKGYLASLHFHTGGYHAPSIVVFSPTVRAFIGYLMVTWLQTMKLFPIKSLWSALLQNLWVLRVNVRCYPRMLTDNHRRTSKEREYRSRDISTIVAFCT